MSDYTKGTNFAAKDALLTGDANKVVSGTEIDDEFALARVAVNSKADETGGILNDCDINNPDLDGGAIDGCTIGSNSPVTTLTVDNINVNGNTISSTDTDGDISLTPNGSGRVNIDNGIDITTSTGNNVVFKGDSSTSTGGFSFETDTAEIGSISVNGINGQITISSDPADAVDNSYIRFYTDGSEKVRILDDGKVGINKIAPTEQLEVDGNVKATEFYGDGSNLTGVNTSFIYVDAGALTGSEKEITLPDTDISELILLVEDTNSSNSTSNFEVFLRAQFSTSSGYLASGDYSGGLLFSYVDWNGASNVRIQEYEGAGSGGFPFAMDESDVSNNWAKLHVTIPATGKLFLEGGYGADSAMGTANGWASAGAAITKFKIAWTGQNFSSGNLYYAYRKNAI